MRSSCSFSNRDVGGCHCIVSIFYHQLNMKAISLSTGGLRFTEVMQADTRDYGCDVSAGEI